MSYCFISGANSNECLELPNPDHGFVRVSGYKPGDVARYKCRRKYYLTNEAQRECTMQGRWSGVPPLCVRLLIKDSELEANYHAILHRAI